MPTQKFYLPDLTHQQEPDVEDALGGLDGVLHVAANHSDHCAEVEFEDDCVSLDEIIARLAEAGFTATPAG